MKRFLQVILVATLTFSAFYGCTTLSMMICKDGIQAKWDRFKSIRPYSYKPVGLVTVDITMKAVCDLSEQICNEVIVPYIELDKEGLISVYAQFVEEVDAMVVSNPHLTREGAAHYVLTEWTQKYGPVNVERLKRAIPFIRNMQMGNQLTKASARLLVKTAQLLGTLRFGRAQLKRAKGNLFLAIKLAVVTCQMVSHVENLYWALHFLDVLKEDQAAETQAIAQYLESFKTKEV